MILCSNRIKFIAIIIILIVIGSQCGLITAAFDKTRVKCQFIHGVWNGVTTTSSFLIVVQLIIPFID